MFLLKLVAAAVGGLVILLAITPLLDRFRRAALRRLLKDVTEVLTGHGVDYWADFGTLLGLVREGDIILGDKDVDLCVLEVERSRVMGAAAEFAARGYRLTGEGGAARKLMRVFDRDTPFYVDIYPYAIEGDTLRSFVASPGEDLPAHFVARKKNLQRIGATVAVPEDALGLLIHRYGPSYRTPRRNDKGRAGGQGLLHSLSQDIEASALFAWFLLKRMFGVRSARV